MEHNCMGINCSFPGCMNNPHNAIRHRTGLRRMTLKEFRAKYGTHGVSDILNYIIEHIPLSKESLKGFKELSDDIKRLLSEE